MSEAPLFDAAALPPQLDGIRGFLGLPTPLEGRAQVELLQLLRADIWRRGPMEGAAARSVLLVPGFFASEHSLRPLRAWLRRLGFRVAIAPVGLNAGPGHVGAQTVLDRLETVARKSGHPVTLIGHSRGGQLATVAAVRAPELVDTVVTLGSPLRDAQPRHFLTRVPVAVIKTTGSWLLGSEAVAAEDRYDGDLVGEFPSSVSRVSIWSRTDGIVDWRGSLLGGGRDVAVQGSHIGLATNADVYSALEGVLERVVAGSGAAR